jgi:hypothetical protein
MTSRARAAPPITSKTDRPPRAISENPRARGRDVAGEGGTPLSNQGLTPCRTVPSDFDFRLAPTLRALLAKLAPRDLSDEVMHRLEARILASIETHPSAAACAPTAASSR